jgi:RecA-family ATPase
VRGPENAADKPPHVTFLDPAEWEGQPIPPRRWLVRHRIPLANVTMLNWDGAAGKTTITLQLAAATRLGTDWLGSVIDEPGPAIFLTAQEDRDEIHRWLAAIVEHHGIGFRSLDGLHLLCRPGEDVALGTPDRHGIIRPTPLLTSFSAAAANIRPSLVAIEAPRTFLLAMKMIEPKSDNSLRFCAGLRSILARQFC